MRYISDRDGNRIIDEHGNIVCVFPDDSAVFNADGSWNRPIVRFVAAVLMNAAGTHGTDRNR